MQQRPQAPDKRRLLAEQRIAEWRAAAAETRHEPAVRGYDRRHDFPPSWTEEMIRAAIIIDIGKALSC